MNIQPQAHSGTNAAVNKQGDSFAQTTTLPSSFGGTRTTSEPHQKILAPYSLETTSDKSNQWMGERKESEKGSPLVPNSKVEVYEDIRADLIRKSAELS
eukprot:15296960-Ditylum_brightwellii.AAC.1